MHDMQQESIASKRYVATTRMILPKGTSVVAWGSEFIVFLYFRAVKSMWCRGSCCIPSHIIVSSQGRTEGGSDAGCPSPLWGVQILYYDQNIFEYSDYLQGFLYYYFVFVFVYCIEQFIWSRLSSNCFKNLKTFRGGQPWPPIGSARPRNSTSHLSNSWVCLC